MPEIGARVKELRLNAKQTLDDVGAVLGLDKSAISRIEKGDRGIGAAELAVLAPHFGVSVDELLFGPQPDGVLLRAAGDASKDVEWASSLIDDFEYVEALTR